jgi:hypothetical protein
MHAIPFTQETDRRVAAESKPGQKKKKKERSYMKNKQEKEKD